MALIPTTAVPEDYRRKLAYKLMMEGTDASPVQHWAQGLARMGQGALGGYEMYQADEKDKATDRESAQAYAALLGGGGLAAPQAAPVAPAAPPMPAPARPMQSAPMASAEPQAVAGPRPGGPVQPTAKAWGDAEAEAAGLYEPSPKNAKLASALATPADPAALPPAAQPAQGYAIPGQPQAAPAPDPRKAQIIQMLQSDKPAERKMGRALADQMIAQQFKPQDYDIHHRADGTIIAVDKKNPNNIKTIAGDSKGIVDFEANKAGAVEQAKRVGAIEFEAGKAGAVKGAELKAAKDIAKPEQDKQNQKVADIVTQDIDRAINTIDTSTLPTTGAMGSGLSYFGGTAAHDLNKLLDTVKSNAGFQELSKMRQASPTGAALGSVTERELALLQSTIGNLEQSQSAAQLKDNLRRVKNTYADIIHGEGKGPPREKLTFQEKQSGPVTIDGYKIRAR
jgi:hypothetical protein